MSPRRAVTEADVREAARAGRRVDLPANAVVTPAARDLAARLGVAMGPTAPQQAASRIVALGADHGGWAMKEALKPLLADLGCSALDLGPASAEPVDYPDFAVAVARAVADGRATFGIMIDGAGIGSCMAANKVAGARAAMCYDVTTAQNAREHNDANVLTLGGTLIGQRLAGEIVRTFLETAFGGGRHQRRVDKIIALDR